MGAGATLQLQAERHHWTAAGVQTPSLLELDNSNLSRKQPTSTSELLVGPPL